MCKYNYKKDDDEEKGKGKEKGKVKVIFQKIKEKIKYMDRNDLILVLIPVLLLVILFGSWTNKKAVDIKVQNQILSKEQLNKNTEVLMNGTSKLNEENFEVFISKKVPNKGIIPLKSTDFINNNNKVILYKAVKTVTISGNPEIIEKLNFNISNNSNMNFKKNTIQIELDSNRHDNSILNLQINPELLTKDSIINDETLLTIEYVESYVE